MNLNDFQHLKNTNRNSPPVDIIMPNFNKEKFIKESINSVIEQTYSNWNLFIVDDNPTTFLVEQFIILGFMS